MYVQVLAWLLCCYAISRSRATTSFPIPPSGHHLLLQHSPIAVALPPVARRQMEILPAQEREPSCSELRSMWRHMRRMGRQMEFTNEIPKLQDPFTASAMRYGTGRRRPSKYPDPNPYSAAKSSIAAKEQVFHKTDFVHTPKGQFGSIVKDQNEVYDTPNRILDTPDSLGFHEFDEYPGTKIAGPRRVPGRFADTSLPEEALGVYGTVVHSPEERARFRARTRRPPDYGLSRYRTPWSDSTGLGRVPFHATKPHTQYHYGSVVTHGERHPLGGFAEFPQEVGQRNGGGARVERIDKIPLAGKLKNTCLRLQSRTCKTDVDCFCSGSPKMFCGGDRCRPLFKAGKYGKQKWGKSWFTDSYERSLMGYGPKRDPVWPGPF
ncbi:uncharacterized protein LOC129987636 [Argiope bruennichi]|uniref:uncharacterized protein LOC129987636 n=1 Tax=Argiope bruennichi TaxID=94029 RepID=UPI002493FBB1|nr:uncharacterized protein LOC129987636 [Argiope bruennichi]XP_055951571.1 uncharacterized protein LOC129987636 [Argiope bruennichi]XP_055951572.1 uncharacterized protein LOC129987636 [Argiope bruennichi]